MNARSLPAPANERGWQSSPSRLAGWIGLFLALVFARRPETFLHPQFWAEDGPVFFVQADLLHGRALVMPSAGYHHLLLRLIAGAASALDARWIPAAYCAASIIVLAGLALALFSPRLDLPYRAACALAIVLIPHTGEAIGNLTNLQWVGALGLVWLLLARDAGSARQHVTDAAIAVVLGLTGTFSILFAPLFAWRAWHRRTRASIVLGFLVSLAAGVQVWTLVHNPPPPSDAEPFTVESVWWFVGFRLPADLFLPQVWATQLPRRVLDALGLLTVGALVTVACLPGEQRERRALLVAALLAVLAATLYRARHGLTAFAGLQNGDRYLFIPKVLVVWLLISGWNRTGMRWITRLACAAMLIATCTRWRYERLPDRHWDDYARRIDAGEAVNDVPLNPGITFSHPGRHRK